MSLLRRSCARMLSGCLSLFLLTACGEAEYKFEAHFAPVAAQYLAPPGSTLLASAPRLLPATPAETEARRAEFLAFYRAIEDFSSTRMHAVIPRTKWKYTLDAWATDADSVFFNGVRLEGAERASFEALGGFMCRDAMEEGYAYAKDGNAVYLNAETTLPGADPASFQLIPDSCSFARDKNHVYYKGRILPGASPASSRAFSKDAPYLVDGDTVYYRDKPLPGADAGQLSVDAFFPDYARTKKRVYAYGLTVPLKNTPGDTADDFTPVGFGYGYTRQGAYYYDQLIAAKSNDWLFLVDPEGPYAFGAGLKLFKAGLDVTPPGFLASPEDPFTFSAFIAYPGSELDASGEPVLKTATYTIAEGKVYLDGDELTGASPEDFKIINKNQTLISTDGRHVYKGAQKWEVVDAPSLEALEHGYFKDKKQVYYLDQKLEKANAAEFRRVGNSRYYADRRNVYLDGAIFQGAVAADFRQLGDSDCFSDKRNVFCAGKKLPGVDAASYQPVPDMEAGFVAWARLAQADGKHIVQGQMPGQTLTGTKLDQSSFKVWADKDNVWSYISGKEYEHVRFAGPPRAVDRKREWFVGRGSQALYINRYLITVFETGGRKLEILPGNPYDSNDDGQHAFAGNTLFHKGRLVASLDRKPTSIFPLDQGERDSRFFWDGKTVFSREREELKLPAQCEVAWPAGGKVGDLLVLRSRDGESLHAVIAGSRHLIAAEVRGLDLPGLKVAAKLSKDYFVLADAKRVYWNGAPMDGVSPEGLRLFSFGSYKGFVANNGLWTADGRLYAYDPATSEEIAIGQSGFRELEQDADGRGVMAFDGRFRLRLSLRGNYVVSLEEDKAHPQYEAGRKWEARTKPVSRPG